MSAHSRSSPYSEADLDRLRQLTPAKVVDVLGFKGATRSGGNILVCCPAHNDRSPSLSIFERDGELCWRCHGGCDAGGDIFKLVALVAGLDVGRFRPLVDRAFEIFGGEGAPVVARGAANTVHIHEPPRTYPEVAEVARVWSEARPVTTDAAAVAVLEGRGLDPSILEEKELVRALHEGQWLPSWARFNGSTWFEGGYRIVLPMFDAAGAMRSLRSWPVGGGATAKRLPPAGHAHAGLVMADRYGRLLLRGAGAGFHPPARIVIAEGEPDFLTWATRVHDPDGPVTSVFGVIGGAWTFEHAARIPGGAIVALRTDNDKAGNAMAEKITKTLNSDRVSVRRATA